MMAFSSHTRRATIPQARRHSRLQVEALEERVVLNNRFVVPAGLPVNNSSNFATLQAALTTPGLAAGDVIQIEPGSTPGQITGAALKMPAVANLTIQGD